MKIISQSKGELNKKTIYKSAYLEGYIAEINGVSAYGKTIASAEVALEKLLQKREKEKKNFEAKNTFTQEYC